MTTRKNTKPTARTIDLQITRGGQRADFIEILEVAGHKLRISIRSDSYDFQSYAKIARWDGAKWHNVHYITKDSRATKDGLAYGRTAPTRRDFAADRDALLKVALAVLL